MRREQGFDRDLASRLPLPLAQLYCRAHDAKTPLEQHLMAYYLWEASLKVLASAAIVAYHEHGAADESVTERLKSLVRPSLGNWWEYVRLLVPRLAQAGLPPYRAIQDLVLDSVQSNLPRATALDAALRAALGDTPNPRGSVRLRELIDRLVQYRNQFIGHGALGAHSDEFHQRMSTALLEGVGEVLERLDPLAGQRLVYVAGVTRTETGGWSVDRLELAGESARRLGPQERPEWDAPRLPLPNRVYLEAVPSRRAVEAGDPASIRTPAAQPLELRLLHPLILFDPELGETFFLCSRRGKARIEYLSYISGVRKEKPELGIEHRALLTRLLGNPVESREVEAWAKDAAAEEGSSDSRPSSLPEPAMRRLGDFELLSVLGRGGMGQVYRAWQPSLGRQVALKCLLRIGDPKAEARFDREIHALGRVEHPHVVKVFTSGVEGDQWYYAMELVEGATLAAVCHALQARQAPASGIDQQTWHQSLSAAFEQSRSGERPLSDPGTSGGNRPVRRPREGSESRPPIPGMGRRGYIDQVVTLVRQAALGAQALHQAGVVHRDIKPGNIMVTADGSEAVLMDLGLAQLADEAQAPGQANLTTRFVGTLRYASPEQILNSSKVDGRSDVYSLGATLWELLTLRPLFDATETTPDYELQRKIVLEDPMRVRSFHPGVSRDLEAIVARCLEKKPEHRYATAAELAEDLRRFLAEEPVRARRVGPAGRSWRWARRRPWRAAQVLLACILLPSLFGFSYSYWDGHREKIAYFESFEKRRGIPVGITPLTPEETRHRRYSLRFHTRAGRLEHLDVVNGHGQLTTQHPISTYIRGWQDSGSDKRECSYVFRYDDEGRVVEEKAVDRLGKVVLKFVYTSEDAAHFTDAEGSTLTVDGTRAGFVRFVRDEGGLERELRWYDANGHDRRPNRDSTYGIRIESESRGWPALITFLDARGEPALNRHGFAAVRLSRDDSGRVIQQSYLDLNGRPTRDQYGVCSAKLQYDARGNPIEVATLDDHEQAVLGADGYARRRYRYNDAGDLIEEAYFDESDRPTRKVAGFHCIRVKYDESGYPIEENYLDEAGKLVLLEDGYAQVIERYNERGFLVEAAYFDDQGRPTRHADGNHIARFQHDARGNVIELTCFDDAGRPVNIKSGFARATSRFDEHGHRTEQAYFDASGRPARHARGYHLVRSKFDEQGNLTENSYFDEADMPTRHADGEHRSTFRFDEYGDRTEAAYFDEGGKPVKIIKGFARMTHRFDERGQVIEEAYFDEVGQPVKNTNGYARIASRSDERGNKIELAYFDEAGKPTRHADGNHIVRLSYNAWGKKIAEAYFDELGKPVKTRADYARITYRYDERGRKVEQAYFDGAGHPARHTEGNHALAFRYDAWGNVIEEAYLDEAGKPVKIKAGYARINYRYDERGRRLEKVYFDATGHPGFHADGNHGISWRYDEKGTPIEQTFLDPNGKPFQIAIGYARVTVDYDDRGNLTRRTYFDPSGKPVSARVVITRVIPGGQADQKHLKADDILVAYDRQPVTGAAQFIAVRKGEPADGPEKELEVLRGGQRLTVKLAAGMLQAVLDDRFVPDLGADPAPSRPPLSGAK